MKLQSGYNCCTTVAYYNSCLVDASIEVYFYDFTMAKELFKYAETFVLLMGMIAIKFASSMKGLTVFFMPSPMYVRAGH